MCTWHPITGGGVTCTAVQVNAGGKKGPLLILSITMLVVVPMTDRDIEPILPPFSKDSTWSICRYLGKNGAGNRDTQIFAVRR